MLKFKKGQAGFYTCREISGEEVDTLFITKVKPSEGLLWLVQPFKKGLYAPKSHFPQFKTLKAAKSHCNARYGD